MIVFSSVVSVFFCVPHPHASHHHIRAAAAGYHHPPPPSSQVWCESARDRVRIRCSWVVVVVGGVGGRGRSLIWYSGIWYV